MIKFIFRWAFRLLILAIVLVVALILLKDEIAKGIAEKQIRKSTGMDVKIGALHFSLTQPVCSVENLMLYNTAEFGGGTFLDVPDLYVEFSPDRAKRELRFKLVRINVRELNIVESLQGRTNITSIAGVLESVRPSQGGSNSATFKGIDTLNLSVGKVRYINMRIPKRNQDANVAFQNQVIQNVRTWDDAAAILLKVFLRAGVTIYLDQPAPSTNRPAPTVRK